MTQQLYKPFFDAEVGEKLEKGLLNKTMLVFFLSLRCNLEAVMV